MLSIKFKINFSVKLISLRIQLDLRSILVQLIEVTKDVRKALVLFGVRRNSQTVANALFLLQ